MFVGRKKWDTETCYNMDEPGKQYAMIKKPYAKGSMSSDFTYINL